MGYRFEVKSPTMATGIGHLEWGRGGGGGAPEKRRLHATQSTGQDRVVPKDEGLRHREGGGVSDAASD